MAEEVILKSLLGPRSIPLENSIRKSCVNFPPSDGHWKNMVEQGNSFEVRGRRASARSQLANPIPPPLRADIRNIFKAILVVLKGNENSWPSSVGLQETVGLRWKSTTTESAVVPAGESFRANSPDR